MTHQHHQSPLMASSDALSRSHQRLPTPTHGPTGETGERRGIGILRKQQSNDSHSAAAVGKSFNRMSTISTISQGGSDSFWELHRKLGERYMADLQKGASNPHAHGEGKLRKKPSTSMNSQQGSLSQAGSRNMEREPSENSRLMVSDRAAATASHGASHASHLHASRGASTPQQTPQRISGLSASERQRSSESLEEPPEVPAPEKLDKSPMAVRTRLSARSSEFSDEHMFVPRMEWLQKSKSLNARRKSRVSLTGDLSQSLPVAAMQEKKGPWYRRKFELNSIVLSPTGHFRSFWDFIGILILVKDTFGIPLQLVDVDVASIFPPWEIVTGFSVIYWCFDIFFSFFTGYLNKGTLVNDCRTIALHYLRTWFVVDLAVSCTDLLLEFSPVSDNIGDTATATRFLRFLRLFRMLHLGKVSRVSAFLQDQFESEVASIQFSLALVMLAMILVEHVIACIWFGLGGDNGLTWLSISTYKDASFFNKYYACVRWALAQLGFGATAIEAVNESEGMYSNVVGFVSLVTSSSVISSMTSLVGALHRSRSEETQQLGQLRRFLRQNQVDSGLSERIMRFLQYTYHARASSAGDNPAILSLLSVQLQNELQYERYKHCLDRVLFLRRLIDQEDLSTQHGQVLQKISMAVVVVDAAEDDTVFAAGGVAEACFFILQGSLRYTQLERLPLMLENAGMAAEMALWTEWTFIGDLVSTSFSKIAGIETEDFVKCICSSPELQHEAHGYAAEYTDALNELEILSDLWRFGQRNSERDLKRTLRQRVSVVQRLQRYLSPSWLQWPRWPRKKIMPEMSSLSQIH